MTSILEESLEYLKKVGEVKKIEAFPYENHQFQFFTGVDEKVKISNGFIEYPRCDKIINSVDLNKLVSIGCARYTDENKNKAIFLKGKKEYVKDKAMENFDKWNDVAGVFEKDTGSYWEIESIIEDSIRIGMKIAENGIGASLDFLEEE